MASLWTGFLTFGLISMPVRLFSGARGERISFHMLRPHEGGIMLHTMYYQDEIREVENFGKIDVELKPAETKVAHQLIEALAADWEPEKYSDTFQENLKQLIKAHLEGKEVAPVEKP